MLKLGQKFNHKETVRLVIFDCVNKFKSRENLFALIIAILIGAFAGVAAWSVVYMIDLSGCFFKVFSNWAKNDLGFSAWLPLILIPGIGGLIVGPMIYLFAREAKGHGVPEVMLAVIKRGGKIRPQVGLVKAVASAITIASGGSVGREGPIVQIGAALGSTIGQWFNLPARTLRTFVGCGAAGGIAAAFNAPIAGALFSVEIILGDFGFAQFTPIVVSSVIATVVSHSLVGDHVLFQIPPLAFDNSWELISYACLGVVAALVSVIFTWLLYKSEDVVDEIKIIPEYVKPLIGGLLLGVIGLQFPEILGAGIKVMNSVVLENHSLIFLLLLILAKMLATCTTLGSGGSGGIFAPSLFLGIMTGKFVGQLSNMIMQTEKDTSAAFGLVGMAAVVGAATHAPITAIMIIFEMTNEYRLILPLMVATVIAVTFVNWLTPESIYTKKLRRKGIDIKDGVELNVLKKVPISSAMKKSFDSIPMDLPINFIVDMIISSTSKQHPVINEKNEIFGMLSTQAIREVFSDQEILADFVIAADVVTRDFKTLKETDDLNQALLIFQEEKVQEIYITNAQNTSIITGVLTKTDLLDAYHHRITSVETGDLIAKKVSMIEDTKVIEIFEGYGVCQLQADHKFDQKTLQEIRVGNKYNVSVLLIKRKETEEIKVIQPTGADKLYKSDELVLLGKTDKLNKLVSYGWDN